MSYDNLLRGRFSDTYIAPYEILTAVSQRSINNQLERIYSANPTLQELHFYVGGPGDDWSYFAAELSSPTVQPLIQSPQNRTMIFYLNIKSAIFRWKNIDSTHVTNETTQIPESVLALSVNLAFDSVEFQTLPPEVRARLYVCGDYSIQQLLIDLNSGSLARPDWARSTVRKSIADPKASALFQFLIDGYFDDLANTNGSVLRYTPKTPIESSKPQPNNVAICCHFENIPYTPDNYHPTDGNRNNMAVYLQMCRGRAYNFPYTPIGPANWVIPTVGDLSDGTMALSRGVFLDGWLLGSLSRINRSTTWVATSTWWRPHAGNIFNPEWKMIGSIPSWFGAPDITEDKILFEQVDAKDVDANIMAKADGAPGMWFKYEYFKEIDDDHRPWEIRQQGRTRNWVFIPEGYNLPGGLQSEFLVAGQIHVNYHFHLSAGSPQTGWINAEWLAKVALDVDDNGKVVFRINNAWDPAVTASNIPGHYKTDIETLITNLKNGLSLVNIGEYAKEWNYVIPGANTFSFVKTAFNKEGDLLCEVNYLESDA